jgi:hypothetical protein
MIRYFHTLLKVTQRLRNFSQGNPVNGLKMKLEMQARTLHCGAQTKSALDIGIWARLRVFVFCSLILITAKRSEFVCGKLRALAR